MSRKLLKKRGIIPRSKKGRRKVRDIMAARARDAEMAAEAAQ